MRDMLDINHIGAAVVYSVLGVIVFWGSFTAVDRATPYDLWQELIQKQNRALATVVGSLAIGLSIIIAASIAG